MRPNLFISYASEDENFVRPLATALESHFKVWFGPLELTLGDSLLRKISEGLAKCDYGVVVLSPHYMRKEWPQRELDGLVNLETAERKVVLPIWKDVTHAEVAAWSPIIAGRLAGEAIHGIAAMVDAIKMATCATDRAKAFPAISPGVAKLLAVDKAHFDADRAERLMRSQEGADKAQAAATFILQDVTRELSRPDLSALKFSVKPDTNCITVSAPYGVEMFVRFSMPIAGSLSKAAIQVSISRPHDDWGVHKPQYLVQRAVPPYFDENGDVVWTGNGRQLSTAEMRDDIIKVLSEKVTEARKRREKT